jgi:hypothetical protein
VLTHHNVTRVGKPTLYQLSYVLEACILAAVPLSALALMPDSCPEHTASATDHSQRERESDQYLNRDPASGYAAPTYSPSRHGVEDVASVSNRKREQVDDEDREVGCSQ